MENSILLAKFIGPFLIVVGVSVLFNRKIFQQIAGDFFKNTALAYVSGIFTFLLGLAVVLFHNLWLGDWRLIITLLGWNTLIKGALLIVMPGALAKLTNVFVKNNKLVQLPWIIMLIIGIFLTVKGYA